MSAASLVHGERQTCFDRRYTKAIETDSLAEMIELYLLLQRWMTHGKAASLGTVPNVSCDPSDTAVCPRSNAPSVKTLKIRIQALLEAKGHRVKSCDIDRISAADLGVLLNALIAEDEWLEGKLFELEISIIDTLPQSETEAYRKCELLVSMLKQESIYDCRMVAFALEECIGFLRPRGLITTQCQNWAASYLDVT